MVPEFHDNHAKPSGWRHKTALALFLAVGLFFLLTEHRAHFFGVLPYLLLLATLDFTGICFTVGAG